MRATVHARETGAIDDAESPLRHRRPMATRAEFERARVANTEIYELKIHTRVDQVKMLWRIDGAGRTVAHDFGTVAGTPR